MLKIEITGDTPLEALASLTAFGLHCMANQTVATAANQILEMELAKAAKVSKSDTPENPSASADLKPSASTANPQALTNLPPEPYVEEPPHGTSEPAPEAPAPKLEEVREKGIAAAKAHGQAAVKNLLDSFGVASMTNLAEKDRAAFLKALERLGEGNA